MSQRLEYPYGLYMSNRNGAGAGTPIDGVTQMAPKTLVLWFPVIHSYKTQWES